MLKYEVEKWIRENRVCANERDIAETMEIAMRDEITLDWSEATQEEVDRFICTCFNEMNQTKIDTFRRMR